jgi:hypothetical protein
MVLLPNIAVVTGTVIAVVEEQPATKIATAHNMMATTITIFWFI